MTFKPKGIARERILVIGGSGVGKSTAYLSIAKKCPDAKFFVLDSDFAIERMLESENLSNVEHRPAVDWADYVEGVKDYTARASVNDWLVVDFASTPWDAVQEYYVDQIHGKDIDAYFLEARKKKAKGNLLDGDTDWGVINKLYKGYVALYQKFPGHIFFTAPAKAIGDRDDPTVKQIYGSVGVRAEGQKHLAHTVHTVLLLTKTRAGEYRMTTVKDRQRKEVENQPVVEFAMSYLVGIAGWRPA